MFSVECVVYYPDTNTELRRVVDWDDRNERRVFAEKADAAIRDGGIVTTKQTMARPTKSIN